MIIMMMIIIKLVEIAVVGVVLSLLRLLLRIRISQLDLSKHSLAST